MVGEEEEFERAVRELELFALQQRAFVRAERVALEARARYVRGQLRWGWFVLSVFGLALGSRVANYVWGPWWWSPWVIVLTAVWGAVVVWRMVRRDARYRRLMGD